MTRYGCFELLLRSSFCVLTCAGDAVRQDRWQRLHPGLPVPLLGRAGLCSGFSECYPTPQMTCP